MEQSIQDRLREEYFGLLPLARKLCEELEAKIKFALIQTKKSLKEYERIEIRTRIKDCESAVDALKRRQEGSIFDTSFPEKYTLTELKDIAGVRILVFPKSRIDEIDEHISRALPNWNPDPIPTYDSSSSFLGLKYYGLLDPDIGLFAEYQIVPMLIGLFWEVEHAALYKPRPELKAISASFEMREKRDAVYEALDEFEKSFKSIIAH